MKRLYILVIILLLTQLMSFAQNTADYHQLQEPLSGNQHYIATEYIELLPADATSNGFSYTATADESFIGEIDQFLVLPPDSNEFGGPSNGNDGVVGSIDGKLSVDRAGTARYSIPIKIPEGMNNMTPDIGIVYNSLGNTSVLGPKWNLSGFSSVNRANPTKYYNNEIDDIDFENDQMILDGNRLIKIFENADSIIYRTEIDQISQIIYYTNNSKALSFDFYKVKTQAGLEKEYGNSLDSRQIYNPGEISSTDIPLIWHLSKIKDKKGNFIKYEYLRDVETGELHPSTIKYTGFESNGSIIQQPCYKVSFEYVNIPERLKRMNYFVNNNYAYLNRNSSLLENVKIYYNESIEIKKYGFEYDSLQSVAKETFLSRITESACQGNNQYIHKNPTIINWDYYSPEYTIEDIDPTGIALDKDYIRHSMISTEINGDNKQEIVTGIYDPYVSKKFNITIFTDKNRISIATLDFVSFNFSDFNNDGTNELLIAVKDSILIYDFLYDNSTELYSTVKVNTLFAEDVKTPIESKISIVGIDYNGDRVSDLAINYNDSIISFLEGIRGSWDFNHFTNFEMPLGYNLKTYSDFTGDKKTDVLIGKDSIYSKSSMEFYTYSYDSTGFIQTSHLSNTGYNGYYFYGDFNADGKTDIYNTVAGGAVKNTFFSYGKGFIESDTIILDGNLQLNYYSKTVDLNNDFRSDFISIDTVGAFMNKTLRIKGFFTQPDGKHYSSQLLEQIFIGAKKVANYTVGDFNGDNLIDIAVEIVQPIQFWGTIIKVFYSTPNDGFVTDLVGSISNGLGVKTVINYQPFSNSISKNTQYAFPLFQAQRNSFTVGSTWVEVGINGTNKYYHKEFVYKKPISHLEGKGFLGFEEVIIKDYHNRIETITSYDIYIVNNKLYYPIEDTIMQFSLDGQYNKNKKLSYSHNSFSHKSTVIGNALIFKPIMLTSFIKSWDNDDAHSYIKTTKILNDISTIDAYGNIGKTIRLDDTDELAINTPASAYDYKVENEKQYYPANENDWLIGQQQNEKITKSFSGDTEDDIDFAEFIYYDKGELGYPSLKTMKKTPNNSSPHRLETWYTYDKFGHIISEILKVPNASPAITDKTINFEYSDENNYQQRFLTKSTVLTDSTDYSIQLNYDEVSGNIIEQTDYAGLVTSYEYDAFGNRYKTILPDQNQTVEVFRWSENHVDAPIGASFYLWSKTSCMAEQLTFYNKHGHILRQVSIGLDENKKIYTGYRYNACGVNYRITEPYFSDAPVQKTHMKEFDHLGRVTKVISPDKTINYTYAGNKLTTTNEQTGKSDSKLVNAVEQLESVSDATGTISYKYYSSAKIKEVVSVGAKIYCSYDKAGFQDSLVDPNVGTMSYIYNQLGQLIKYTDEKSNISQVNYDDLGRIKSLKILNTGDLTTYKYNTTKGENGFGMLKSLTGSNNIAYSYVYDEKNRPISYKEQVDGSLYTFNYTYDTYGRLQTETYPTGFAVEYKYNKNGHLVNIREQETAKYLWKALAANAHGQLEAYGLGNGLTTNKQYDEFGMPKRIVTGDIQDMEFEFNPHTGNLNWRKDHRHSLIENFTYDTGKLNERLTGWQVLGQQAYSIEYEDNGNITSKSDITQSGGSYAYEHSTKLHAATAVNTPTPEYLAIAKPETIEYTAFDKVSYIKQTYPAKSNLMTSELNIYYGPKYQRKKTEKWLNNTLLKKKYFIGANYEIEIDSAGKERKLHYLYGGDGLFAIYEINDSQKKMNYIHNDYLGSYQAISDSAGNLVEELSFDAWGRRRNASTWTFNNMPSSFLFDRGYTGHEHFDQFNLINMNGRVYDPYLARFLSPDPLIQAPDYTQNYNRYSYVLNNPLIYTDPSGYGWFVKVNATQNLLFEDDIWTQEALDNKYGDGTEFSGGCYYFDHGYGTRNGYDVYLDRNGGITPVVDLYEVEVTSSGETSINMTTWNSLLDFYQDGSAGGGDGGFNRPQMDRSRAVDISNWPLNYSIEFNNIDTQNMLNGRVTAGSRLSFATNTTVLVGLGIVKKVPLVGLSLTVTNAVFSTIFFLDGEVAGGILSKYNNIDASREGVRVEVYTTYNSYVGSHQSAIFYDNNTGQSLGWLPNF